MTEDPEVVRVRAVLDRNRQLIDEAVAFIEESAQERGEAGTLGGAPVIGFRGKNSPMPRSVNQKRKAKNRKKRKAVAVAKRHAANQR